MKYAWIHAHRDSFPVALSCVVLEVSKSGYYASIDREASERAKRHERIGPRSILGMPGPQALVAHADRRGGRLQRVPLKVIDRVEVNGFPMGTPKRHGCPSHGIALTPDEREIWLCDSFNSRLHIFDATVSPPSQGPSVALREQPGWVTFSLDGAFAYPSTGEVIATKSRKIIATLSDEEGRPVHSEKLMEIDFAKGKPLETGDQFGLGRVRP